MIEFESWHKDALRLNLTKFILKEQGRKRSLDTPNDREKRERRRKRRREKERKVEGEI